MSEGKKKATKRVAKKSATKKESEKKKRLIGVIKCPQGV